MTTVLQIQALKKNYVSQKKPAIEAVRGISFTVKAGQCFGLLGPNGAGKTTTLEIIEGVREASGGNILFYGKKRDESYRERIGVLFQQTALPDLLTVGECLEFFHDIYSRSSGKKTAQTTVVQTKADQIRQVTDMFDLGDLLKRYPQRLSGGQRQRLLLAITVINDPDIIFLDEPTTGLDPMMRQQIWTLITRIKAQGKAIVLTTHYMQEAETLCDEIAIMNQGRIAAHGSPQQLLSEHFADTMIRLPADVNKTQLAQLNYPVHQINGWYCFSIKDVDAGIAQLQQLGISLTGIQILPPSMDELYIKLTQANHQSP